MTRNQIIYIVQKSLERFDKQNQKVYLEEIISFLTYDMRTIGIEQTDDLTERLRYYELKDAVNELKCILAKQSVKKKSLNSTDDNDRSHFDEAR